MAVIVACPSCGRTGSAPEGCEGKSARCNACGATFKIRTNCGPAQITRRPELSASQTPRDLLTFAAGRGHAEFPCLSPRYSPASRVPCADFSRWLCDRIAADDAGAIADFVWRVVEANPGVGIGSDGFRQHWQEAGMAIYASATGKRPETTDPQERGSRGSA